MRPVDVFAGAQFDADFLKLNPLAKVPVITDSDGPGGEPISVFESGAILLYLADKTGELLPHDPRPRANAIQWMMVQMTNIGPMCGQLVHFKRFAPAGNDYAVSRYATQVHRLFELYDQRLASQSWVGGAELQRRGYRRVSVAAHRGDAARRCGGGGVRQRAGLGRSHRGTPGGATGAGRGGSGADADHAIRQGEPGESGPAARAREICRGVRRKGDPRSSFPRMRESRQTLGISWALAWMPDFAGVTDLRA